MPFKPVICIEHWVDLAGSDIRLYPHIHSPFLTLMGALYPRFASYTKAEKGWSAFTADGTFIGCFAGLTLQSVRKNPFFSDPDRLFLKALLAGLVIEGYRHHSSVCSPENYGTLRLWQKLGLGAKLDTRGKARSAYADPQTTALLDSLLFRAKLGYPDERAYADRQMAQMTEEAIAALVPTEATFGGTPAHVATVTLGRT